jgi:hypothetical protein
MEKETEPLIPILVGQWSRVWDVWEELIRTIPDDEWARGKLGYLTPARHAIHVLDCAYILTGDFDLDRYDPAEWFRAEVQASHFDIPSKILWSREKALAKLAETRVILDERVTRFEASALLDPETAHPWAEPTRLNKMLYVLRHTSISWAQSRQN